MRTIPDSSSFRPGRRGAGVINRIPFRASASVHRSFSRCSTVVFDKFLAKWAERAGHPTAAGNVREMGAGHPLELWSETDSPCWVPSLARSLQGAGEMFRDLSPLRNCRRMNLTSRTMRSRSNPCAGTRDPEVHRLEPLRRTDHPHDARRKISARLRRAAGGGEEVSLPPARNPAQRGEQRRKAVFLARALTLP